MDWSPDDLQLAERAAKKIARGRGLEGEDVADIGADVCADLVAKDRASVSKVAGLATKIARDRVNRRLRELARERQIATGQPDASVRKKPDTPSQQSRVEAWAKAELGVEFQRCIPRTLGDRIAVAERHVRDLELQLESAKRHLSEIASGEDSGLWLAGPDGVRRTLRELDSPGPTNERERAVKIAHEQAFAVMAMDDDRRCERCGRIRGCACRKRKSNEIERARDLSERQRRPSVLSRDDDGQLWSADASPEPAEVRPLRKGTMALVLFVHSLLNSSAAKFSLREAAILAWGLFLLEPDWYPDKKRLRAVRKLIQENPQFYVSPRS